MCNAVTALAGAAKPPGAVNLKNQEGRTQMLNALKSLLNSQDSRNNFTAMKQTPVSRFVVKHVIGGRTWGQGSVLYVWDCLCWNLDCSINSSVHLALVRGSLSSLHLLLASVWLVDSAPHRRTMGLSAWWEHVEVGSNTLYRDLWQTIVQQERVSHCSWSAGERMEVFYSIRL